MSSNRKLKISAYTGNGSGKYIYNFYIVNIFYLQYILGRDTYIY